MDFGVIFGVLVTAAVVFYLWLGRKPEISEESLTVVDNALEKVESAVKEAIDELSGKAEKFVEEAKEDLEDLAKKTKKELVDLAKERGLEVKSKMKKDEILDLLITRPRPASFVATPRPVERRVMYPTARG